MGENFEERVTTLQSEFCTSCNLLSSKSVSDRKIADLLYTVHTLADPGGGFRGFEPSPLKNNVREFNPKYNIIS